jgi:mannan endo-1,4-beta-mannosidase
MLDTALNPHAEPDDRRLSGSDSLPVCPGARRTSRRRFLKAGVLAVPALAVGCKSLGLRAGEKSFVVVKDGHLELNDRPYAYVGANLWYGCYLGDPELQGGRERLVRELDRLRAIGVTNLRVLAGSETSPLVGAISRGITRAPGEWDENLLKGLDFCLAEMARRDMRAVLFLSNYWQWSGGFAQYVRWATGETIPDPDLPRVAEGDWEQFMQFSARVQTVPEANELYRNYIRHLVTRRNTVNGRRYAEDPAIMSWQLANEPRPGPDTEQTRRNLESFYSWVDSTARFIHELAPRHLVSTGSEGTWGCLEEDEIFLRAHQTPAVDYVSVHMWLKNWGWLKVPVLSPEFEEAAERAKAHVERHNVLATDVLGKPLTLEEFGLPRDHERYEPGTPTEARDEYYRRMFDQVHESVRAGRALQGANFWAWGGEGRAAADQATYAAGALTGDPFCEPQGLNSVFDVDQSTLVVIDAANHKLRKAS